MFIQHLVPKKHFREKTPSISDHSKGDLLLKKPEYYNDLSKAYHEKYGYKVGYEESFLKRMARQERMLNRLRNPSYVLFGGLLVTTFIGMVALKLYEKKQNRIYIPIGDSRNSGSNNSSNGNPKEIAATDTTATNDSIKKPADDKIKLSTQPTIWEQINRASISDTDANVSDTVFNTDTTSNNINNAITNNNDSYTETSTDKKIHIVQKGESTWSIVENELKNILKEQYGENAPAPTPKQIKDGMEKVVNASGTEPPINWTRGQKFALIKVGQKVDLTGLEEVLTDKKIDIAA